MSTIAKRGSSDYKPAPEGTHSAVCSAVIDLGTQYSEKYGKSQHKVLIGWELDTGEEQRPTIWRRYSLSLHEKAALRQHLEAWRGRSFSDDELNGFDLKNVLAKPCLATVKHRKTDAGTYSDLAGVSSLPKGIAGIRASKTVYFDIDNPDMAAFTDFSDSLKATIEAAEEWKARAKNGPVADDIPFAPHGDDDIPF